MFEKILDITLNFAKKNYNVLNKRKLDIKQIINVSENIEDLEQYLITNQDTILPNVGEKDYLAYIGSFIDKIKLSNNYLHCMIHERFSTHFVVDKSLGNYRLFRAEPCDKPN